MPVWNPISHSAAFGWVSRALRISWSQHLVHVKSSPYMVFCTHWALSFLFLAGLWCVTWYATLSRSLMTKSLLRQGCVIRIWNSLWSRVVPSGLRSCCRKSSGNWILRRKMWASYFQAETWISNMGKLGTKYRTQYRVRCRPVHTFMCTVCIAQGHQSVSLSPSYQTCTHFNKQLNESGAH